MGDLSQHLDQTLLRDALWEQAPVVEEAIVHREFLRLATGTDPASGRAQTAVYRDHRTTSTLNKPTQQDLQLVGGLYQYGDVILSSRVHVQAPRDSDGLGGDQFQFWGQTWRIVGMVHQVTEGGRDVLWKALLRRV